MDSTEIKLPEIVEKTEEELMELQESPYGNLSPKHQRFCHLYLSGRYTMNELAQLMNVAPNTIRMWLKKSEIMSAIEQYQVHEDEIIKQSLKALRLKAMHKMGSLIDSPVDGIAWQAAKDILDRTGHKAVHKTEMDVNIKTYEQQINEILKDLNEPIDVGYKEID